jgi:PAS domain S-box-containing protein
MMDSLGLPPSFCLRIIDETPALICLLKRNGTTIFVNRMGEQITGYTVQELVGKDFWHILHPGEQYKQVEEILHLFAQVEVLDYEMEMTTRDGVHRVIAWTLYGSNQAETDAELIAYGVDVTKRSQAEREREQLLYDLAHRSRLMELAAEVSTSLSTILDVNLLINRTVEQIKEHFGFYYVGLFLVDQTEEYAELRAGTGEAGQQLLAVGHKLKIGEGSMIGWTVKHARARIALDVGQDAVHFNNSFLPLTRSELALPLISRGHCIGALTFQSQYEADFSQDDLVILEVMAEQLAVVIENARLYEAVQGYATELEKRVAERTTELTAVNRELEAFAYSVSHDLRAPLRAIDGFSQALLEDNLSALDEQGQDYLHRVRAASRRMGQLISDLLKLSRLTRGEMNYEIIDLSTMADELAEELCKQDKQRQVEFHIQPDMTVKGDARLLRIALENLLGNAWKFTAKQPQARIEFSYQQTDGRSTYFVKDNGAGFDMNYVDKLFGAFQRLHPAHEFEGSGIGLVTVQRVIHRHGGRIWAEGQVDQGAIFYFTL